VVRIEVNAELAARRMGERAERAGDQRPAHAAAAMMLRGGILLNFRMGGHFPEKWDRSAAADARGGKTLVDTATLRNSVHASHGATYGAAGTDVVYAAVHQFGFAGSVTVRAHRRTTRSGKVATVRSHSRRTNVPARPFLPVDAFGNLEPKLARRIRNLYGRHIVDGRTSG
jgi:phage gpG-like protein